MYNSLQEKTYMLIMNTYMTVTRCCAKSKHDLLLMSHPSLVLFWTSLNFSAVALKNRRLRNTKIVKRIVGEKKKSKHERGQPSNSTVVFCFLFDFGVEMSSMTCYSWVLFWTSLIISAVVLKKSKDEGWRVIPFLICFRIWVVEPPWFFIRLNSFDATGKKSL